MRIPWKPGRAGRAQGPVVISLTEFRIFRWRDAVGMWLAGMRLRRSWPRMDGAVGMWLWAQPLRRRSGAVSVWTSEDDLRRFVGSPIHVEIVRRYRGRGSVTSTIWRAPRFARSDAWSEARRRLDLAE